MRIAVTGSAGYIGGWLALVLAKRGHEVTTQDMKPGPGIDHVFDLSVTPVRQHWLKTQRPEIVIHLAALYGRVWGEKDLVKTVSSNTGLTAELARDTAAAGARLMFMSSSEVYGDSANQGTCYISPRRGLVAPLKPRNMYGMSKKWGEEACRHYAPDGLMITRLNMPYGPAAVWPEQHGAIPETSGRAGVLGYNALHTMLWEAWHDMPITVHRGCKRCFTFVTDTCRGLAMIAESGQEGVWNVNSNKLHITTAELARRCIAMVPGCASVVIEEEPDSQITLRKMLDSDRLWQMGWRPEVDLETGMKATLDYISRFDRDGRWAI